MFSVSTLDSVMHDERTPFPSTHSFDQVLPPLRLQPKAAGENKDEILIVWW